MSQTRRQAREAALQALYAMDLNRDLTVPQALAQVTFEPGDSVEQGEAPVYAGRLVRGVREKQEKIDRALAEASANWRLERMAAVDRNLLRLAAYELLCEPDVPAQVVIDEAIEIAKRYGTAESMAFINGVLDKVARLGGNRLG